MANLLHAWKRKYGSAAEQVRRERGGKTPEDELKRLRRENATLRQERDVPINFELAHSGQLAA